MTKNKTPLELYLHIPFCVRKCKYCDFLSAPAPGQVQNAYMDALLREVQGRAGAAADYRVRSVFIGGGTPSVVEPERIRELLDAVRRHYTLEKDAEISMEVNPGAVTGERLAFYRESGVNRLSIGCQSADDKELEMLGRVHTFAQFTDTYRRAREAGFANVNVDLISALPGQTMEDWERTLYRILALDPLPEHISAYSLILEEGTAFYEQYEKGLLREADEDLERDMYWRTAELLKDAGYEHYEISNYAREGYACRHNCGYWRRTDYLGFGIGAASLRRNVRFSNDRSLERYLASPLDCVTDRQSLSVRDRMAEEFILGLRMAEGVDLGGFRERYGVDAGQIYGDALERSVREGLLERRGDRVSLTGRGVDVSNYVMARFL